MTAAFGEPPKACPDAPSTPPWRAWWGWGWRFGLAFLLLNTLLTFENREPGFGVVWMPRLSFELCVGVAMLSVWVAWRGRVSTRLTLALAGLMVLLAAVRYADVTAPAVMGRPVNLYWDGQHAVELLRVAVASWSAERVALVCLALLAGLLTLLCVARWAIALLGRALQWAPPRPWLLAAAGALTVSFAAYVPDVRDTRWFFSLPLTPTITNQATLLAQVLRPGRGEAALGPGPAFDGDLGALRGPQRAADVVVVFAESYGAITFDDPLQAEALAASRLRLQQAIDHSGRAVVSARVRAATFGGASWLSHASLLSGVDASDPGQYNLLLASDRPTLVTHFARHGYRTVGWMPGIKRPWPEGRFYGFDRLADDPRLGYVGPDFGYWRVPDQVSMALLHEQELDPPDPARQPVFAVFPTVNTHAPFQPLPPLLDPAVRLTAADAFEPARTAGGQRSEDPSPVRRYLDSMDYQHDWLAGHLGAWAPRDLVLVVVGDHQPPALVSGRGTTWDVPVHVIASDTALLRRFEALGFVPGLNPPADTLGPMHELTQRLLLAFDGQTAIDLPSVLGSLRRSVPGPHAPS